MRTSRRRHSALTVAGAALASTAALGGPPAVARAHDLRPTDPAYHFDEYERVVNRDVTLRQLYQWPTLTNALIFANIRNGLNGAQFSYGLPPAQVQVVVQAYASANAATYDDAMWAKYRLGEALGVKDPQTGQPATRNIWWASSTPAPEQPPADRAHPYYADTSLEGLARRGVLFLT
jgi:hypothetical protein